MDLSLQDEADYLCSEAYTVDTRDHEDHTFCGVMFSVKVQKLLPLQYIEITSLWVRGHLGDLTVYVSPDDHEEKHEDPSKWKMVYNRKHEPSPEELVELKLGTIDKEDEETKMRREAERERRRAALQAMHEAHAGNYYHPHGPPGDSESIFDLRVQQVQSDDDEMDSASDDLDSDEETDHIVAASSSDAIRVQPGEGIGIYVHSKRPDDMALVYDNQRSEVTHADQFIKVLPGLAHLSNQPFSGRGWGWGSWRRRREFVGRVTYGCKYRLWQPHVHHCYPRKFRAMVRTLLLVHRSQDGSSSFCIMPADCVLYILNMCHWGWAGELEEDEDLSEEDKQEMEMSGRAAANSSYYGYGQ